MHLFAVIVYSLFGFMCIRESAGEDYEAKMRAYWTVPENRAASPDCANIVLAYLAIAKQKRPHNQLPAFMRCQVAVDPPQRPLSACMQRIMTMDGDQFARQVEYHSDTISQCMIKHALTEVLADPDQPVYCHWMASRLQ